MYKSQFIAKMVKVIQMQSKHDWKKYYTPEQAKRLEGRARTYSVEDQQRDAKRWQLLIDDLNAAVARKEDPASKSSQELAKRFVELINAFIMGDPGIEIWLSKSYQAGAFPKPYSDEVQQLVSRAVEIFKGKK